MKRTVIIAATLLVCFIANAQSISRVLDQSNPFLQDGNGRPLYISTTNNSEGSPYFTSAYKKADILLHDGRFAKNVKVKFDLLNNQIQYVNEYGVEMIPNLSIKSFIYVEPIGEGTNEYVMFQNGFPPIGKLTEATYYQVLDSGTVKLLKYIKVNFRDDKPYNSPEVTRVFERSVSYYAYSPTTGMVKIEKNPDVFADIFKARQKDILAFINEKKLKLKSESDYIEVFRYHQSLQH